MIVNLSRTSNNEHISCTQTINQPSALTVFDFFSQIRHRTDETQCVTCPFGTIPDRMKEKCEEIPEQFLRPESGWAIGAMAFSSTGILITMFVVGVFLR